MAVGTQKHIISAGDLAGLLGGPSPAIEGLQRELRWLYRCRVSGALGSVSLLSWRPPPWSILLLLLTNTKIGKRSCTSNHTNIEKLETFPPGGAAHRLHPNKRL